MTSRYFREVQHAITNAILQPEEELLFNNINDLNDPEEILAQSKYQIEQARRSNNSIAVNLRFHQGRALHLHGALRPRKPKLQMSRQEKVLAEQVYALFYQYDWIINTYYGTLDPIRKLTVTEISEVRKLMRNMINWEIALDEELNQEVGHEQGLQLLL